MLSSTKADGWPSPPGVQSPSTSKIETNSLVGLPNSVGYFVVEGVRSGWCRTWRSLNPQGNKYRDVVFAVGSSRDDMTTVGGSRQFLCTGQLAQAFLAWGPISRPA